MPDRSLNADETIDSIRRWLKVNLLGPIIPITQDLELVPPSKGLYFWFMSQNGYTEISRKVAVAPIEPHIEEVFEDIRYHLVYLGTAGTGKSGGGDLQQRLTWHITQEHTPGSICHGTLSTFRAGLGSMLSDDLILDPPPSTAAVVSRAMEEHFKVFWIKYKSGEEAQIDADELTLIRVLRPLFNIKNNPNSWNRADENPTKVYRRRRNFVYENTRIRLSCAIEGANDQKKKRIKESSSFQHQVVGDDGMCLEFTVTQNQSIAEVVRGIDGLPSGNCNYLIGDSNNRNRLVYPKTGNNPWRTTGRGEQNIYTCFANSDEGYAADHRLQRVLRWQIIQDEMSDKIPPIREVTVRVCRVSGKKSRNEQSTDILEPLPKTILLTML
jgi:hypothetical protein